MAIYLADTIAVNAISSIKSCYPIGSCASVSINGFVSSSA
uniref:Uncharacterized protein n=1 Tax=Arundo donax TaxID=35708 RepID=A0A0A9H2Q0_ARUDO